MTAEPTTDAESRTAPSRRLSSIRFRLLGWFIALLTLAGAGSVLVVREILLNRLDERIDRELVQETKELRALAAGNDPETGEPFGDRVRKIFSVYLERNTPSRNEALITFVNGQPFLRSRPVVPYRLDKDADLVERWGDLTASERGRVATPAGAVEFLAVPIRSGGETSGVFVVAIFRDLERRETDSAIAGAAGTGLFVLLVGSLLAWRLADMILTPVQNVRETARSISETDFSKRIEVEGRDEISELANTFNEMLDRIERSFQTQKKFIDDASHELRTPITIIRGHLETLEADPEDRERTIALVLDELGRMSRLVDDLLLLARSERPDLLDLDVVDVETLTSDVHAKAGALGSRNWVLKQTAQGRIVGDRQRLTQALIQLSQNALQHTEEGDVIEIGSELRNGRARFWVRDEGSGVPIAEQERIFQRFARGRDGRRGGPGAGIGLAIVRAIARAHNGNVDLDSAPGRGSTFSLVIPVDQPSATHEASGTQL